MSNKISQNSAEIFRANLKELIGNMGIAKWAKKVGIGDTTVGSWTRDSMPGADHIIIICNKLDVSADWLLLGRGSRNLNQNRHVASIGSDMDAKTVNRFLDKIDKLEAKIEQLESKLSGHPPLKDGAGSAINE